MDARFRRWVSRRSHDTATTAFHAQSYDASTPATAPYRGSFPVAGNAPLAEEMLHARQHALRRPSLDHAAPPDIQRGRRSVDAHPRPSSAHRALRSLSLRRAQRRRSASSLDRRPRSSSQSGSGKQTRRASLSSSPQRLRGRAQVRSMSAFAPDPPTMLPALHVDLLDAQSTIRPMPGTHLQRLRASGTREYGEDVADRNLASFGGGELDSRPASAQPSGDPERAPALTGRLTAAGMRGAAQGQPWPGAARGSHTARWGREGAGDDTSLTHRPWRDPYSVSKYVDDHQYFLSPPTLKPAIPPTGRQPGKGAPSTDAAPQRTLSLGSFRATTSPRAAAVGPRASSVTPTKSHLLPRHRNPAWSEPTRPASAHSYRPPQRYPAASNQRVVSPSQPLTPLTLRPEYANRSTQTEILPEQHYPLYDSSSISQMSLTTSGSPTTTIPRASLEKELPPTPDELARARSNKQATSRLQEPARQNEESESVRASEDSAAAFPPDIRKAAAPVHDATAKAPLPPGFDLSNTTDTEVITHQRPAVVHEYVTPKVHEIREKKIMREIHTYDVFHRIQPIVDVEVLPTKHYVPTPNGDGLTEVPAAALPGRHTEWEVRPVDNAATSHLPQHNSWKRSHPMPSTREPILDSEEHSTSPTGVPRIEKLWRHPAELETGGQQTGQTVPIHLHHPNPSASNFSDVTDDQASMHTANEAESELLFKDSNLAFGGALPGLEERNPVVEGTTAPLPVPPRSSSSGRVPGASDVGEGDAADEDEQAGVGEATKSLRRRRASMTERMKGLSVAE